MSEIKCGYGIDIAARDEIITRNQIGSDCVCEASEIGFAPGEWPKELSTKLGNGTPFLRYAVFTTGERRYVQRGSDLRITVLND